MKALIAAVALSTVATPAFAETFANNSAISIVDGGETTSSLAVSCGCTISNLNVSLYGLSHTYPDDLVFGLLNETAGLGFVFMSQAGGSTDISNVDLTFNDFAEFTLPESFVGGQITSGTYLPSNYGFYEFTFFNNAASFADFNGLIGDGTWTLYVDDVFPADGGSIARGWSISFDSLASSSPEPASWAMMLGGFGLVGGIMRSRKKAAISFA